MSPTYQIAGCAGLSLIALAAIVNTGCATRQEKSPTANAAPEITEGYPPDRLERMRQRQEALTHTKPPAGMAPFYVFTIVKRWDPGSTISVAFRGGTPDLHRKIAQTAATWTLYGNIGLDFGYDPVKGYRQWQAGDANARQEIRIAFDAAGYWSCIGTDGLDGTCSNPGETSLNLSGFDKQLPLHWEGVVLHEFGHALGLMHEHQNPQGGCDVEMQWDPVPGYEDTHDAYQQFMPDRNSRSPGVYKFLSGPLNNWDRPTIDRNMRQLPDSHAFDTSQLDGQSIMKYSFPEWMYVKGTNSPCYSVRNDDLSPLDQQGMARLYPRDTRSLLKSVRERMQAVSALSQNPSLPAKVNEELNRRMKALDAIK